MREIGSCISRKFRSNESSELASRGKERGNDNGGGFLAATGLILQRCTKLSIREEVLPKGKVKEIWVSHH